MNEEDSKFQEFLRRKLNTPTSYPTTVSDAGKHNPGKCNLRMFFLHATCGCMWFQCQCGYQDTLVACTQFMPLSEGNAT